MHTDDSARDPRTIVLFASAVDADEDLIADFDVRGGIDRGFVGLVRQLAEFIVAFHLGALVTLEDVLKRLESIFDDGACYVGLVCSTMLACVSYELVGREESRQSASARGVLQNSVIERPSGRQRKARPRHLSKVWIYLRRSPMRRRDLMV